MKKKLPLAAAINWHPGYNWSVNIPIPIGTRAASTSIKMLRARHGTQRAKAWWYPLSSLGSGPLLAGASDHAQSPTRGGPGFGPSSRLANQLFRARLENSGRVG